ncbi:hypothetical protein Tco_1415425, partial [Tanacetum coccineum]
TMYCLYEVASLEAGKRINDWLGIQANHWFGRRCFQKHTWHSPIGSKRNKQPGSSCTPRNGSQSSNSQWLAFNCGGW